MKLLIACFTAFIFFSQAAVSQSELVSEYLKLVAKGNTTQVKTQLPDLLAEYPNDPGVMLLHGVVIEDAFRAVKIYERIAKNYPRSQWADDAYWRIVQFYAILGDIRRAEKELNDFRSKYPASEFIVPATDVVRSAISIARKQKSRLASDPEMEMTDYEEPAKPIVPDIIIPEKQIVNRNEPKKKPAVETPPAVIETNVPIPAKAAEPKAYPVNTSNSKTYGLQVGIFSNRDYADAEMRKFLKQRMRTEVKPKVINGENMYAVVIGNYSSKESAEAAKLIVQQQCDCNPIVFEK